MEHITETQKKKYETILSQIDSEFEKKKRLEDEISAVNNKIIAVSIAKRKNVCVKNIFRTDVKVFDSVFQIYELYDSEISLSELKMLATYLDKNYYLITVFISKHFIDLILNQKWFISVRVKNSQACVMKNVNISSEHNLPIKIILPFQNSLEPTKIDVTLFVILGNTWTPVNVSSTLVDISYYFRSNTPEESLTFKNRIYSLLRTNNYSSHLLNVPKLEYEFRCKCSVKHFFNVITRNSYYKLNSKILSSFTADNKDVINVELSTGTNSLVIKLDNEGKSLKITSLNGEELSLIKEYIIDNLQCQSLEIEKIWLITLKNLRYYIRSEMCQEEIKFENLKIIYEELNKLKYCLPV